MKIYQKLLPIWVVMLALVACNDDQSLPNGYVETTQEDAATLILKGYEDASIGFSVFQPDGFDTPFYIREKNFYGNNYLFSPATAARLDAMREIPSNWQSGGVEIQEGGAYWAKYVSLTAYKYVKFRVALVEGNNVTIEYVVDRTEERPNVNANPLMDSPVTSTMGIPRLNADNYYVDHFVSLNGSDVWNYSLEWDDSKKHAAWVAFSFDAVTKTDAVGRTDAWAVDPLLPAEMQVDNSYHTSDGFDRGHLCASEDRVYSKEANEQTFYYSNMSPQLNIFNAGFWAGMETLVRNWGRTGIPSKYDKLYVVKGGTLNNLLKNFTGEIKGNDGKDPVTYENGFTVKGLACPKYYFMAALAEKGTEYHAIGLLVEHREDWPKTPTSDDLKACAVSIDELEQMTGLDFFCNLPDDVEDEVESAYSEADWDW